jgi:hypothetical protein
MMSMSLRICQWQTCRCCRQILDSDAREDVAITVALFGAVALAICPRCKQQVDESTLHDRNYRRRARRTVASREAA